MVHIMSDWFHGIVFFDVTLIGVSISNGVVQTADKILVEVESLRPKISKSQHRRLSTIDLIVSVGPNYSAVIISSGTESTVML